MRTTLTDASLREILVRLSAANRASVEAYPGERPDRQPVHTVYGGAHLFTADVTQKLGHGALRSLEEYAPDPATFAQAIGLEGPESLAREPGRDLACRRDRVAVLFVRGPVAIAVFEVDAKIFHRLAPEFFRHAVVD